MKILLAVIDDLYTFAVSSLMALFRVSKAHVTPFELSVPPNAILEPEPSLPEEGVAEPPATFKSLKDILHIPKEEAVAAESEKNTVMYVGSTDVPLYKNPTQEFDTVLATIRYGEMVMTFETKGRYARVAHGDLVGWVLREDLSDRAAFVYPDFTIGEKNELDDPNTIRVRAMIDDLFSASRIEFPLQAGEYVVYRLLRKGIRILWPPVRPRTPGRWHTILKGVTGVHIGVTPKTGSVMEYTLPEEIGHLAYVEAVFPDQTINISEANFPDCGIYNERVLTRNEWRELKPVFIQIS